MDAEQCRKAFAEFSKRVKQSCDMFTHHNKRSWTIISFGLLYLLYRSVRFSGNYEMGAPEVQKMISKIIFISLLLFVWFLSRSRNRNVRLGYKMTELKQFASASLKNLGMKSRPDQAKTAFRPKPRASSKLGQKKSA